MTTIEKEMLDFLMRADNLPHVVEIMRRSDDVERQLLKNFWDELSRFIQRDKTSPISPEGTMELRVHIPVKPWKSDLQYVDRNLEATQEDYLRYCIYFEDEDEVEITYGIEWTRSLKEVRGRLKKLPAVTELLKRLDQMKRLGQLDRDEPRREWSVVAWRCTDYRNTYDFLSRISTDDRESILQEVGTNFCKLVNTTRDLVINANKEIVAMGG